MAQNLFCAQTGCKRKLSNRLWQLAEAVITCLRRNSCNVDILAAGIRLWASAVDGGGKYVDIPAVDGGDITPCEDDALTRRGSALEQCEQEGFRREAVGCGAAQAVRARVLPLAPALQHGKPSNLNPSTLIPKP